MWTRGELKSRAWESLRTSYWKAFLVSLLLALVGGGGPSLTFNTGGGNAGGAWSELGDADPFVGGLLVGLLVLVLLAVVIGMVVAIAFGIFFVSPLTVGVRKYFKQAAVGDVNMNYLGRAFSKGRYWPVVKTMFLMRLFIFLWTLLLVVPGIVKSYSYSLVPYLLADNPTLDSQRAITLSRTIMYGQKWRTFVLDLSFLGWYLLGMLALLIGTFFVLPYHNAAKAELYLTLREEAIRSGQTNEGELTLQ